MIAKPIIFLDLDGVCADFMSGFQALCRKNMAPRDATALGEYDLSKLSGLNWEQINYMVTVEENFWLNLQSYPWAQDLVRLCRRRSKELYVLSSPWVDADSRRQKTAWVTRCLGLSADDVILTKHKHLLSAPGRVLIDDLFLNCGNWVTYGGHAINFPAHHNGMDVSSPVDLVAKCLDELEIFDDSRLQSLKKLENAYASN